MAQQYLSTDPNAGEPVKAAAGYLSTDPNAGRPVMAVSHRQGPPPTWADRLGLPTGVGPRAAVDVAEGAASGLASSIFQGGDIIRRNLGMPRVIANPGVQQAMTAPPTTAGSIGRFAEQASEFTLPASALTKLPLAARMVAGAAAGGTAAAVQSNADPVATMFGLVGGGILPPGGAALASKARQVAAGASEDGLSGALAGAVRSASPVEPGRMLTQALKPAASRLQWDAAVTRAMPEIKQAAEQAGKPITGVADLLTVTKTAKQNIQAQLDQFRGRAATEVDFSAVADAVASSVPSRTKLLQPDRARELVNSAGAFRRTFSLDDAETLLRETNAELDSFYGQFPQTQRAQLAANPAIAGLEAQARAMRDAIYRTLDAPNAGEGARELNRRYGSILEVERAAHRRANVAARQQPESLSEQIGAVRAAGDMARGIWRLTHGDVSGAADIAGAHAMRSTAKALKESQTTDALIRRAFSGVTNRPSRIEPVRSSVRGLTSRPGSP